MSDNKIIKFEIVTPEKVVLKEIVKRVTVPTREGEITILPNHIPIVNILASGVIELEKENGEIVITSVSGGFIEVFHNKVVILADFADRAEEIDEDEAQKARARAEESLANLRQVDKEEFANINAVIARELARIKAAMRWKNIK